jgi:hypothetical protein
MSEPDDIRPDETVLPQQKKTSTARKVGLGAALVVLPVAALQVYNHLEAKTEERNRNLGKSFNYPDMAALKQVDASLVKYKELTRIETGMQSPEAIALDQQGNLLVAGEGIVRKFNPTGAVLGNLSIKGTPTCLAADDTGRVFVGFKDHVEIFGTDGKLAVSWKPLGERAYITGITLHGQDVWVADAGRRVVVRCDLEGKVLGELGRRDDGRGVPGLTIPSPHLDVAMGSDGLVWTVNTGRHRFEAYTPGGQLEKYWGQAGTGIEEFFGCCNPTDFALLSDGSFITAEKGMARIKKYHADGRFDCVVAPPSAFGDNMLGMDVTVNAAGQVLVLERGTRVVRMFTPNM